MNGFDDLDDESNYYGINEYGDEFAVQCQVCDAVFQSWEADEGCPSCGMPATEWRDVLQNPESDVVIELP